MYRIIPKIKDRQTCANSADFDQTPPCIADHAGTHFEIVSCLSKNIGFDISCKYFCHAKCMNDMSESVFCVK